MNDRQKLKEELQTIVNLLFDYKNDHELTDDQHDDLKEIVEHVQNALNYSKDYAK